MEPLATQTEKEIPNWDFAVSEKVAYKGDLTPGKTVKDSQFKTPLIEFSGACAGCGETAYIKLVTQLFGDRMMIANATGCSSIWGGSAPSTPYTTNHEGKGPAWANSLFEDNAEFGYGMFLAVNQMRSNIAMNMEALLETSIAEEYKETFRNWIASKENGELSKVYSAEVEAILDNNNVEDAKALELLAEINNRRDYLVKRSQWILGGDGWAYDIGYGGLDHVLASGDNVNVLVFDTEIYSNTGGQSSKSTPTGAIAQFAAGGKETKKKDLAGIAMSYGYVYVAHISMGADMNQCVKALAEAEAYPGPSLIIAYAPCINHGIKKGMSKAQTEEKLAVESGYWFNFRYNPTLAAEGKDAFSLDSKEPTGDYQAFLKGENRYASLAKFNPERAAELFAKAEKNSKDEYDHLKKLVTLYAGK